MSHSRTPPADTTPDDVLDELLVLRGQAGDRDAIEQLVRRWQPRLLGYARRLVGRSEVARDVAQEAWLGIVRGLHRLEDPRRFRAYAMRIVMRRAADQSRRAPVEKSLVEDPAEGPADVESDAVGRLRNALLTLPPDRRALLALRYQQNMDDRTISTLLGIPAGTVKSRLHGARERLREIMERPGVTERTRR